MCMVNAVSMMWKEKSLLAYYQEKVGTLSPHYFKLETYFFTLYTHLDDILF